MKIVLGMEVRPFSVSAVLIDSENLLLLDTETYTVKDGLYDEDLAPIIAAVIEKLDTGTYKPEVCIVSTNRISDSFFDPVKPKVGLVLIGYNQTYNAGYVPESLPVSYIRNICGGHYASGAPIESLGIESLESVVTEIRPFIDAFAVSSYAGVSNREHEETAAEIIEHMCGMPVWCGTELSDRYHAIRRVNTTVLSALASPAVNALVSGFDKSITQSDRFHGFHELVGEVPVYFVNNEGGLTTGKTCASRPLSFVLSSVAARTHGLTTLLPSFDVVSVDMTKYRTTCTISEANAVSFRNNIAFFDNVETCVDGIDVREIPIGHFSRVIIDQNGITKNGITLGEKYATPIWCAYNRNPKKWHRVLESKKDRAAVLNGGCFVIGKRHQELLTATERTIIDSLHRSPLSAEDIAEILHSPVQAVQEDLENLCAHGVVETVGLTLYDLLAPNTVLKRDGDNVENEYSRLLASCLRDFSVTLDECKREILRRASARIAEEIGPFRTPETVFVDSRSGPTELEKMIAVKARGQYLAPALSEYSGAIGATVLFSQ